MTGLYIIMAIAFVILLIVLIGFFEPEHSDKQFWIILRKTRAIIDKVSYYFICFISIGILALLAGAIVSSLIDNYQQNKSVISLIVSTAIISVIGLLAAICIRNIIKDRKNSVRCECIGDCSKCKIQCQTNTELLRDSEKDKLVILSAMQLQNSIAHIINVNRTVTNIVILR